MPTELHLARLEAVGRAIWAAGARSVLDLGCGTGELLTRLLAENRLERIVGVDSSIAALETARRRIHEDHGSVGGRLVLIHASCTEPDPRFRDFDAAALVETIEHIPPDELSRLESLVFRYSRPRTVIITTPNRDCNPLHGIPEWRMRHRDHHFEWGRERFAAWTAGVARRNGYAVRTSGLGAAHPRYGAPSQMANFARE